MTSQPHIAASPQRVPFNLPPEDSPVPGIEAPPGEHSDHALLTAWRTRSDEHAARQLYRRHFDIIFRFFRNKVADPNDVNDLVSETFSRLFGRRDQYAELGLDADGQPKVRPFLFGIAKNVLFAYIRNRGRSEATVPLDDQRLLAQNLQAMLPRSLSSIVFTCRKLYALTRALRTLPLRDQILIENKYFGDLSERELAAELGIPITTLPGRSIAARKHLKEAVARMLATHGIRSFDATLDLDQLLQSFRVEMMKGAEKPPL